MTVTKDTKSGSASTTDFRPESLRELARRAEKLAEWNKPDPEHQPPLGPQEYAAIDGYVPETAACPPAERAKLVGVITRYCESEGAEAAGTCYTGERLMAVGDSAGLFGYHRWTTAGLTCTVRTSGGAGSSRSLVEDVRDHRRLDAEAMVRRTHARARLSEHPRTLEAREYPILLEPQGVAMFMLWLAGSLDARAADEGRSAFSNRAEGGNLCGKKIVGERVTLASSPSHPQILGCPFHGDGRPVGETTWVENGVLKNLYYSRYWAQKQGKPALGPAGASLVLSGGAGSVDDLLCEMKEGLLVTTLWYIRSVDPNQILVTGLTRDGVFWVENGEIAYPVKNFRFNDSPLRLFSRVEAMSDPVPMYGHLAPAMRASAFGFTSVSDAI
ncbi:TldD/PmbA family protein [bacterium]|nr:TldD/PmbA family protein [bacterium]